MLTTIFNFFVVPTEENVVQLTSAEIKEILEQSTRLVSAGLALRQDTAVAFGIEEEGERPSVAFVEARAQAEARTGVKFHKFFS